MMVLVAYIFSIPNGLWDYFMKFRVYIFQALSSYTNQTFQMTIYINQDIIILWCCIIQTKLFLYSTNQIMAVTLIICLHNAAIPPLYIVKIGHFTKLMKLNIHLLYYVQKTLYWWNWISSFPYMWGKTQIPPKRQGVLAGKKWIFPPNQWRLTILMDYE